MELSLPQGMIPFWSVPTAFDNHLLLLPEIGSQ
jgi:hypothetical protein